MLPGCYAVVNDSVMKLDKMSPKQADFTVFAVDPQGTRTPFAPPGYAGAFKTSTDVTFQTIPIKGSTL